jgi:16S rRNA (cytidine1402-2'-O)-methyltransferase
MPGTFFLVATPIGNLEDITYRAVRVLREVDLIACEDTRQTRKLLDRYAIHKPLISYHEHNEEQRATELISKLLEGFSVALVSDAGTPLVSDPGYRLVARAIEEGVPIQPVPGPSALLTALSASGLPTSAFYFGGFLPHKPAQRRKAFKKLKDMEATLIFYEAPHRILDSLADVEAVLGPRPVVLARELTKIHEEFLRGSPHELRRILEQRDSIKGEFTLLVGRAPSQPEESISIQQAVETAMEQGMTRMEAMKAVARRRGISKREVYRVLENGR